MIGAILTLVVLVSTAEPIEQPFSRSFSVPLSDDADVAVSSKGIQKIVSTTAANGDIPPGVEAASVLATVNTALSDGNFAYAFEVTEPLENSWTVGKIFKIEVIAVHGTNTDHLAALYVHQNVADDAAIEGVIVKVDLGESARFYDNVGVMVTSK